MPAKPAKQDVASSYAVDLLKHRPPGRQTDALARAWKRFGGFFWAQGRARDTSGVRLTIRDKRRLRWPSFAVKAPWTGE